MDFARTNEDDVHTAVLVGTPLSMSKAQDEAVTAELLRLGWRPPRSAAGHEIADNGARAAARQLMDRFAIGCRCMELHGSGGHCTRFAADLEAIAKAFDDFAAGRAQP